jgi:hypothetical protein
MINPFSNILPKELLAPSCTLRHARLVAQFPGRRHRSRHLAHGFGHYPPSSHPGLVPRTSSSWPRARPFRVPTPAAWPTSLNHGLLRLQRVPGPRISLPLARLMPLPTSPAPRHLQRGRAAAAIGGRTASWVMFPLSSKSHWADGVGRLK